MKQFGTFDNLEDRRELMQLFVRMGHGLSEHRAGVVRAKFLQSLLGDSTAGFDGRPMKVTPCSAVQAYHLFIAITGCLGVRIEGAAAKLEAMIR